MTTTRAAVLRHPQQPFTIETVELPDLGPQEILVRVVGAGMCHSDLVVRGIPEPDFRPTILGHEGAGVVEAVGAQVRRVTVGDHVVLSYDSCGHCRQCRGGEPSYCDSFLDINVTGFGIESQARLAVDGSGAAVGSRWFAQSSFAEFAVATETSAVVVSRDLDIGLMGPLGCGMQTGAGAVLRALRPHTDDAFAVFGAGAVGLAAVMAAAASGVRTILAVDIDPGRLELAGELGATVLVDGRDPDAGRILREASHGLEFALDTTGNSAVVQTAISALGRRGTLALVGATPLDVRLDPIEIYGRTITYLIEGNSDPQQFVPELIGLWQAGRFPFERLIRTYPFAAINEAEGDSLSGATVKPILLLDS